MNTSRLVRSCVWVAALAVACGGGADGETDGAMPDAAAGPVGDAAQDLPDGSLADASASSCPEACTRCRGDGTCVIDCGSGECDADVVCPPDRACEVNCVGAQACESGHVDCSAATSCNITCMGEDACDNGVECAGASCTVLCDGIAACEDVLVTCDATACDVTCTGQDACAAGVCCDGASCGADCTSSGGGNCVCP